MIKFTIGLFAAMAAFINALSIEVSDFENGPQMQSFSATNESAKNPLCKKDHHIIENQSQLDQLARECTVVEGSISLQNYHENSMDLGRIKIIEGDFLVEENNVIISIHGTELTKIGGIFKLYDLTALNAVFFPKLNEMEAMHWRIVPILSTVELDHNLESIKSIFISDSSLTSLEGFNNIKELQTLNINNNRYLESISTSVKYISEQLSISANADDLSVELKELVWANNITIRDTRSLQLDNLKYVNNSMEFIENKIVSLELSNLKSIGGTLGIIENKILSDVDLNNLTYIEGGLMISGNEVLENIDFFKELKVIGGAIQFTGNIKDTEFPNLRLVKGSAIIESSSEELDCGKWISPAGGSSIIRGGKIECTSKDKKSSANIQHDGKVLDKITSQIPQHKEVNGVAKISINRENLLMVLLFFSSLI